MREGSNQISCFLCSVRMVSQICEDGSVDRALAGFSGSNVGGHSTPFSHFCPSTPRLNVRPAHPLTLCLFFLYFQFPFFLPFFLSTIHFY